MLPHLPGEIKERILVRVPAKILVRFSLVSKQWRSLISDPKFIKKHLDNILSNQYNHHRLLINSFPNFYSLGFESHTLTKLPFPFETCPYVRIMGSCHGLVLVALFKPFDPSYLLCDDLHKLALWNPIKGDYIFLPEVNIGSDVTPMVGFGYDPLAEDYKVVRVVTDGVDVGPAGEIAHRVEVYSLKTNSWRRVKDIPYYDPYILSLVVGATLVNESVYWLTCYEEGDQGWEDNLILGFDFVNEEFEMLDIRKLEDIDKEMKRSLTVVDGCLALYQTGYDSENIVMWMFMKDELNHESGSTLLKINKSRGMNCNVSYISKKCEALLATVTDDELCMTNKKLLLYDLVKKNNNYLDFSSCGRVTAWSEEMIYVETLVSLNGRKVDKSALYNGRKVVKSASYKN